MQLIKLDILFQFISFGLQSGHKRRNRMQYQREREAQLRTWVKTQDHIPFLPPLADRTLHLCRAANSFVLINTFPSLKSEKLIIVKHFFFDHLFIATGKIYPQRLSVNVLFHWAISFLMLSGFKIVSAIRYWFLCIYLVLLNTSSILFCVTSAKQGCPHISTLTAAQNPSACWDRFLNQ